MVTKNYLESMENQLSSMEHFRRTTIEILGEIKKDLNARQINPFEGIILFMSMFSDIDWKKNGTSLHSIVNSREVRDYSKRFRRGHGLFFGPGMKKNGMEGTHKPGK